MRNSKPVTGSLTKAGPKESSFRWNSQHSLSSAKSVSALPRMTHSFIYLAGLPIHVR